MADTGEGRTAVLLGASGLVGGACLELLLREPRYVRVRTLGRRPLERRHAKLEDRAVDFERLGAEVDAFRAEDVFCCLGTTLRRAGTRAAFRRVDLEYPLEAARLALAAGARRFLLVSAVGANAGSRVFYNRVKGELEDALRRLPFDSLGVVRPSLLLGERGERRTGERLAQAVLRPLAPLLRGRLARYRPIAASEVAAALVWLALHDAPGTRIVESEEISRIAQRLRPASSRGRPYG